MPGSSETTIIRGTARHAKGFDVRVSVYLDQVSFLEKTLATDIIDEEGNFELSFDLMETVPANLYVRFVKGLIYLQPGEEYEIELLFDPKKQTNIYFERESLETIIIKDDGDELNRDIWKLNSIYDDFILDHFNDIYKRGNKYLIDTLQSLINQELSGQDNQYFKDYVEYMMAAAEQFSRKANRLELADKYLVDKEILYNNTEYIYFFNQFFEKYLFINNEIIDYQELLYMFDNELPLKAFNDSLALDPALRNINLREFLLLNTLKELYYMPDFKKEHILNLITEIGDNSSYPEHRLIAGNLVHDFSRLKHGTLSPGFLLMDEKGVEFSLEDFRGKYLLLCFYVSDNPSCLYQLGKLKELHAIYGDRIQFVCISADKGRSGFAGLVAAWQYPWTFLYFDHNYELLESYDAMTFPLFLILDDQGKIYKYPAPYPDENIERILEGI